MPVDEGRKKKSSVERERGDDWIGCGAVNIKTCYYGSAFGLQWAYSSVFSVSSDG